MLCEYGCGQEAIRKLRFTARKTMMVAQQLYEGIDLGPGIFYVVAQAHQRVEGAEKPDQRQGEKNNKYDEGHDAGSNKHSCILTE